MEEVSPGIYSTIYVLKINEPFGTWNIGVQGIKILEDGKIRAGWGTIPIRITPANIALELISPSNTDKLYVNSTITIRVKATYPDDSLVLGGVVNATISNALFNLKEVEQGIYEMKYKVPEDAAGSVLSLIIKKQILFL